MKKVLCTTLLTVLLCANLMAGSVTLAWNASTSTVLTGYKLYYGNTSNIYTKYVVLGKQTTTYTVSGLNPGKYYFAVTATFSTTPIESTYSNEVSTVVPQLPPPTGFTIK